MTFLWEICGLYEERGGGIPSWILMCMHLSDEDSEGTYHVETELKGLNNLVIEWHMLSKLVKINTVLNTLSLYKGTKLHP
mmetsp:Transcript_30267/g.35965  ORF Transcript_30267/g.35965 Transcript_30267/m.35965 type:complete len:80 (-) Transcript_30267:102-341(-)